jgi:hypothetical protein
MAMAAQAEMQKAQADMAEVQRKAQVDQFNAQNNQAKTQVDVFEAQTQRMSAQVDAQKAGAEINFKNIQAFGEQLNNKLKMAETQGGDVAAELAKVSTADLISIAQGGMQ